MIDVALEGEVLKDETKLRKCFRKWSCIQLFTSLSQMVIVETVD